MVSATTPFIQKIPVSEEDPKLEESQVEQVYASLVLTDGVPLKMEQTIRCYWGSATKPDANGRPSGLIGPLEHELLPDSIERRLLWVASIVLNPADFGEFIGKLPSTDIVKRMKQPQLLSFPSTPQKCQKDCFDQAFEKEAWYQKALEDIRSYSFFRNLALNKASPIPFLKRAGYKQVGSANLKIGDLVIYFSHQARPGSLDPYSPKRKISHYGRICEITKERTVFVLSKIPTSLTSSVIYRHRIDCIPHFYGSGYLFFTPRPLSSVPETDSKDNS